MAQVQSDLQTTCYHCGSECQEELIFDDKPFCCDGCQTVYQILSNNNLCSYYKLNTTPGATQSKFNQRFEYLDDPKIMGDLVDFSNEEITIVTFYIPAMHCSSCIWLLEQLHKINTHVASCKVDFLKKQATVVYNHNQISLRLLAEQLTQIGYEPLISLQDIVKNTKANYKDTTLIKKIGVAGFCFGNIMIYSFPEYFGISALDTQFQNLFRYLNLVLIIPIVFYAASDYFRGAYQNLKAKNLNIDFPLALGILIMFLRTYYEVLTGTGQGFADTLAGLTFFILIGKWLQQRTYYHLSFERDYKSYFPVAVTLIKNKQETPMPLADLTVGDRILVRNEEIIPADAILLKGQANIDFSFVTGEAAPVGKVVGDMIYAGGRQKGEAIELEIIKPVSQSYLTRLWNNEAFHKSKEDKFQTFSEVVIRYFTITLLLLALSAFAFWAVFGQLDRAFAAFTAVLIIACPCALSISTPFTMSMALNILDKNKFYLKGTEVVEQFAKINTIVFDKTGTITSPDSGQVTFVGKINKEQQRLVASLVKHSSHPLSKKIYQNLRQIADAQVQDFYETSGSGISASIEGNEIRLGKMDFVLPLVHNEEKQHRTEVHLSINKTYIGAFVFEQHYRSDLAQLVFNMQKIFSIHLLSGDKDHERDALKTIFGHNTPLNFQQTPLAKLEYIQGLQAQGNQVLMIGDGLNDAGALRQSNLGVAITENINNFTPGSDAILDASKFGNIITFYNFARGSVRVVYGSFAISLIYNVIGLSYAVQGSLSPLFAAILMPLSTVTIISFTSATTWLIGRKYKLVS